MPGTGADQASGPASGQTQQQETLHKEEPNHRASGPDQQPGAHRHGGEPDAERPLGPDVPEHTSELSRAERTRSPRGEGFSHETQQPFTINLGKDLGETLSKSRTDRDGTAWCYHAPDASQGQPAPPTPLGGKDPALTPESMFQKPGWTKDRVRQG